MNSMRTSVPILSLLFFSVLLLLSSQVAAEATTPEVKTKPYTLGVILPLSGQFVSLSNYVKNGIDLAYSELPAEQQQKLQLVFEDDQFDPTKTISAYRKLQSAGGVDGVFVVASSPANALGPITEREKKILIAIGASDPNIAVGKEFSFIHWVIPPVLGDALAAELQRRELKAIGFIAGEVTGAIADMDAAIASLQKLGLGDRVIFRQEYAKTDTDFRTAIAQLREKKADTVVAVLFPGQLSSFAKQLKVNAPGIELVGMETFEDEAEIKAADGTMEGGWYVNASDPTGEFTKKYRARFHSAPGWGAGNGYDALKLMADAVSNVGNDSVKIRDYLRSIKDYHGATGVFSSSGDNRFTLPAALKRITATGFETFSSESDGK